MAGWSRGLKVVEVALVGSGRAAGAAGGTGTLTELVETVGAAGGTGTLTELVATAGAAGGADTLTVLVATAG